MAANYKIAAISNPHSGKNKRGGFTRFTEAIASFPEIAHLAVSAPAEVVAALQQFEQDNIGLIILNGGDGTLQLVLTYLLHTRVKQYRPKLVLLQAGTTSMAFGDVGCKAKLRDVLDRVVAYAAGSSDQLTQVSRSVLRMQLPANGQTICGLFFGAGAIYSGTLYCRQKLHTKGLRGELGPSLAMIRFLLDWLTVNKLTTPANASVVVDEAASFSGEFNIVAATTLQRLLMGAYPFWAKRGSQEHLAMTAIQRQPPQPVRALVNILRGRAPNVNANAEYYRSYCASSVRLNIDNGFTLDGELFGAAGVTTEVVLDTAGSVSFLTV